MEKPLLKDGKIIYPNKLKLKKNIKIGLIGSGNIAQRHADVVLSFNHKIDVLLTKSYSKKTELFKKKYNVSSHFISIKLFKEYLNINKIDAIIVCVSWNNSNNIFNKLLDIKKPVLFEKSLNLSLKSLQNIKKYEYLNNFSFAYNRNYYDFWPTLASASFKNLPEIIQANLPDTFDQIIKKRGAIIRPYLIKYITSHWITFLYTYLKILGSPIDLSFKNIDLEKISINNTRVLKMILNNKFKTILIISLIPNNSSKTKIEIFSNKYNFVMQPLENLKIYDVLNKKIIKKNNIYYQNKKIDINVDTKFKPGFRAQYYDFVNSKILKRYKSFQSISIKDLKVIYKICELLK